ncbi:Beta-TrCP [Golovinomyces cichoracearum]|uniref:Beta-TrCP n=1 Tax=Golovinomyces cichoracearum TaxID=62708 RepID=A0A420IKJ8_9PEZI|nr:Beta-TrCP [Golovinomyces cichoracearum]
MKMNRVLFPTDNESLRRSHTSRSHTHSLDALSNNQKQSLWATHLSQSRNHAHHSTHNQGTSVDPYCLTQSEKRDGRRPSGGIRGLIKKASESFKNRRRHLHEHEIRPLTAWGRLKSATGIHPRSRSQSALSQLSFSENERLNSPVPGNGNQPPKIPHGLGGSAARAAAAAENRFIPLINTQNNNTSRSLHYFHTGEQQEDRESGIGIAVTATSLNRAENIDLPTISSEISRVDFISNLPSELAIQILVNLDQTTLRNIAAVSKQWLKISQTQCIWREVFLREQTKTYASSRPIPLGAGLGLPLSSPSTDWKDLYRIREQLKQNWMRGTAEAVYLNGHLDSIYCVQFDEKKIITGSRDKTIRVWDLKEFTCKLIIGPPDVVNSPSIMTADDGRKRHFALMPDMTKEVTRKYPETVSFPIHHNQSILCLQYDEEILATGSSDGTCILHDIKNGYQPIRQLRHHTAAVLDLAFDTRHIVTCSKDITICIWNRESCALIKQLRGHGGPVNAVQLRGNTIVSCSGDFRVKLWNIDTGKNIKELAGHTKGLACSQFSEDSRFIASAGNDKSIRIWDANSGESLKNIVAHENLVRSLHIDSISGRLISGSYDQDIKVFDMATGALLLDFPKWHSSWVLGAKSDYRRIISTGQDPKILIMDFGMNINGIEKLES